MTHSNKGQGKVLVGQSASMVSVGILTDTMLASHSPQPTLLFSINKVRDVPPLTTTATQTIHFVAEPITPIPTLQKDLKIGHTSLHTWKYSHLTQKEATISFLSEICYTVATTTKHYEQIDRDT